MAKTKAEKAKQKTEKLNALKNEASMILEDLKEVLGVAKPRVLKELTRRLRKLDKKFLV